MQLPQGITVGHWSDPVGRTGCTVVLALDGAVWGSTSGAPLPRRSAPSRWLPVTSSNERTPCSSPAGARSGWPLRRA